MAKIFITGSLATLWMALASSVAFAASQYDLAFATYLGGTRSGWIRDVCADQQGNIIAVGGTQSPDFPTTPGAYDGNAFLTVIASDLKSPIYSTFRGQKSSITGQNAYGGIHGSALAPDSSWIVGGSWCSSGWPTQNAYQTHVGGVSPDYADATLARFVPVFTNPAPRLNITVPANGSGVTNGITAFIEWPAVGGILYAVEWSSNLTQWFLADTVTAPLSGGFSWTDDGTKTGGKADHRSYRLWIP